MQQTSPTTPSAPSPSFAGLLAALAAPADKQPSTAKKNASPWDDELAEDIATLSYESALRAHSRYRSPGGGENSLAQGASDLLEALQAEGVAPSVKAEVERPVQESLARPKASTAPELRRTPLTAFERSLKDASITIRVSKAECDQLHRRAAEAGLTVSAYLRSCTFEAESLRAMVKETMAQLRSTSTPVNPPPVCESRLQRLAHWVARLANPWHGTQRVVRA
jgi:hypothetical protein